MNILYNIKITINTKRSSICEHVITIRIVGITTLQLLISVINLNIVQ